jgi:hypothetical protein
MAYLLEKRFGAGPPAPEKYRRDSRVIPQAREG